MINLAILCQIEFDQILVQEGLALLDHPFAIFLGHLGGIFAYEGLEGVGLGSGFDCYVFSFS